MRDTVLALRGHHVVASRHDTTQLRANAMTTVTDDPLIGTVLTGRFEIGRPLGHGGYGHVYEALDRPLGRLVALKVLRADMLSEPHALARFRREAHTAAALSHPHIAAVIAYADPTELEPAYIVFERVDGMCLSKVLGRGGRIEAPRAVAIATQVLSALAAAHALGVVHRDLKPSNVMLVSLANGEHAKLLDFGIARLLDQRAERLTVTGTAVGTPRYMSPEQLDGGTVDPRTDIWGLGILMYRMLAGRVPFEGPVAQLVSAIRTAPPPAMPPEAEVPLDLEAWVGKCLRKLPDERWASAQQAAEALAAIVSPPRTTRGRETTTSTDDVEITRAAKKDRRGPHRRGARLVPVAAMVVLGLAVAAWASFIRTAPPVESAAPRVALPSGPLPARLTLAEHVRRAASAGATVTSVRADGVAIRDGAWAPAGAGLLEIELRPSGGGCVRYWVDAADRVERTQPVERCAGTPLDVAFLTGVLQLARASCPAFSAGPVSVSVNANIATVSDAAGREITVHRPAPDLPLRPADLRCSAGVIDTSAADPRDPPGPASDAPGSVSDPRAN